MIDNYLSENTLAIFLFHGVIEKNHYTIRNYNRKHIEKDYFYNLLKKLKKEGQPISVNDCIYCYNEKKSFPPKSFIISFDDGFENNFSVAAPILEDLKIPAIFYVTTDFINNNHMSWIDKIEYCLEYSIKGKFDTPWSKEPFVFNSVEDKITLLDYLRKKVKKDSTIDVDELVCSIFSQCNIPLIDKNDTPIDLKMNWSQVKELDSSKNFMIGGHSHTHRILSFLDKKELADEIKKSILMLQKNLYTKVSHYSYPEGLKEHYSSNVIDVLKTNGIICCPSAEEGTNTIDDNLFHLKRIMVT